MDFFKFLPQKMQDNIVRMRADPKLWAKFQVNIIKYVIGALCLIIAYQFVKVIIGFNSGSSTMNMIGRLTTFLIMAWILYTIYIKSYVPMKDRLLHYADKTIENRPKIDVDKVVDDTFKHFEKEVN